MGRNDNKTFGRKIETWPLYAAIVAYAMNTFASLALSHFCHLNLFLCAFPPLDQFTTFHKDYLQLLKEKKTEFKVGILVDYKIKTSERKNA